MDDDGQVRDVHARHARGTARNATVGHDLARNATVMVRGSTNEEPARTIHEAVERCIVARELDDDVATWSREGA